MFRCCYGVGVWGIMAGMAKEANLFAKAEEAKIEANAPLAVRMRPRTLDEFAGQLHFVGPGKLLRRMLEADRLTSVIFYGPPGVGKTSLARVIANQTKAQFNYLSAPAASVKDIRDVIAVAKDRLVTSGAKTVLFIDEIHRFNRAQQDVLLDDVETGIVILIGATTENPYFAVNSPLISRSTVFRFELLSKEDIIAILRRAAIDKEHGMGNYTIELTDEAADYLAIMCDGDARKALTAFEVGVLSQAKSAKTKLATEDTESTEENKFNHGLTQINTDLNKSKIQNLKSKIVFDIDVAKESIQQKTMVTDKAGDTHYDLASALQKSMRGSDPDATVYWLARLIAGGEDPRFIARRIAVCAAEDVGNADPMATVLAAAAVQISEFIGFPEAQLPLAQAAIYIACAPKSNAAASAIWSATSDINSGRTIQVPKHLKDSHYAAAKKEGIGAEYKYPHSFEEGFVPQDYLGVELGKKYYTPTGRGHEKNIAAYLQKLQQLTKNK
ncbi:MAG: replication-associated recombination protein A [Sedimentisphaerales bacterium]|nr:replication-associated recombination protein A [Sedimentisphaerales bacterium]